MNSEKKKTPEKKICVKNRHGNQNTPIIYNVTTTPKKCQLKTQQQKFLIRTLIKPEKNGPEENVFSTRITPK